MVGSVSELEKDIEASRARLDQTIDRIQDRLTTGSLIDEVLGSARRTPLNGVYDNALDAVRRNPVPVLLIVAGVTLLLRGAGGKRRSTDRLASTPVLRTGADRTYDPDQPTAHPASETLEEPRV